jgi:hypothetical protein
MPLLPTPVIYRAIDLAPCCTKCFALEIRWNVVILFEITCLSTPTLTLG